MYNDQQKQQFLNQIEKDNSYKRYAMIFKKTEPIEESFGKDIADMSLNEIENLLDRVSGKSMQTIVSTKSMISSYVDWCIRNGKSVSSENNVNKLEATSVNVQQKYRSAYVSGDKEFLEILDTSFPEVGFDFLEVPNAVQKSVCWLFYLGLEKDEAKNLKKSDVDYENRIIHSPLYDGIVYSVDERLLKYIRICVEADSYQTRIIGGRIKNSKLCDTDYVYRPMIGRNVDVSYDKPVQNNYLWRRVNLLNKAYLDTTGIYKKLTITSLADSKRFYDYYMAEDKESYLDALRVDNSLRGMKDSFALYKAKYVFKNDYESWKNAFY